MKRREFIRKIEEAGCTKLRSGAKHDVYIGPHSSRPVTVPRHTELSDILCKEIRKELGIS